MTGSVRAAELIAALSLATDLGIGVPLEHGLQATLVAMRLSQRLDADVATAQEAYYLCLLFYVGCTAVAPYWRAMATRSRSSGSMKWSWSSSPTSSWTQWIFPVNRLVWAV